MNVNCSHFIPELKIYHLLLFISKSIFRKNKQTNKNKGKFGNELVQHLKTKGTIVCVLIAVNNILIKKQNKTGITN